MLYVEAEYAVETKGSVQVAAVDVEAVESRTHFRPQTST
jgi:hypothetical protein